MCGLLMFSRRKRQKMDSPDYRFAHYRFARLPIRPDGFAPDRFAQLPIRPITDSPSWIRPAGFARLFAACGFHPFGNEHLGIALWDSTSWHSLPLGFAPL